MLCVQQLTIVEKMGILSELVKCRLQVANVSGVSQGVVSVTRDIFHTEVCLFVLFVLLLVSIAFTTAR
jgi:hypothetical protein